VVKVGLFSELLLHSQLQNKFEVFNLGPAMLFSADSFGQHQLFFSHPFEFKQV